jgi:hypothetical protein
MFGKMTESNDNGITDAVSDKQAEQFAKRLTKDLNVAPLMRANPNEYRTLQRYRGGGNPERTAYMEKNSMLTKKALAVSVEQVSIFLTDKDTVVSFFEHSADDIETPILRRLDQVDTILRQSSDPSMLVQAILDATVDLAIPVTAAYEDIMSELEVDVLTDPDIGHSRLLYILSSELSLLRGNMNPISSLIANLKDHRQGNESKFVSWKHISPLFLHISPANTLQARRRTFTARKGILSTPGSSIPTSTSPGKPSPTSATWKTTASRSSATWTPCARPQTT